MKIIYQTSVVANVLHFTKMKKIKYFLYSKILQVTSFIILYYYLQFESYFNTF